MDQSKESKRLIVPEEVVVADAVEESVVRLVATGGAVLLLDGRYELRHRGRDWDIDDFAELKLERRVQRREQALQEA